MENEIITDIFHEKQYLRQPWIIGIVLFTAAIILLVFGYGFYIQIIQGIPFGNKPMPDFEMIISFLMAIIFAGLMSFMLLASNLETIVRNEGLYFRYFPFINKFKKITKNQISSYSIRKYRPIAEYLGWGIRFSLQGNGIAYNTSGNIGLQLELNNGKKILIGTHLPETLINAMNQIYKGNQ
jgi:hypothetical protein